MLSLYIRTADKFHEQWPLWDVLVLGLLYVFHDGRYEGGKLFTSLAGHGEGVVVLSRQYHRHQHWPHGIRK